jgi:hypothetical protein
MWLPIKKYWTNKLPANYNNFTSDLHPEFQPEWQYARVQANEDIYKWLSGQYLSFAYMAPMALPNLGLLFQPETWQ